MKDAPERFERKMENVKVDTEGLRKRNRGRGI